MKQEHNCFKQHADHKVSQRPAAQKKTSEPQTQHAIKAKFIWNLILLLTAASTGAVSTGYASTLFSGINALPTQGAVTHLLPKIPPVVGLTVAERFLEGIKRQ